MSTAAALADGKFPVGIVGVGNMGGGMARNLLRQGWPVEVFDIRPEQMEILKPFGAIALDRCPQAAIKNRAIILTVVTTAQARAVLFGEADGVVDRPVDGQVDGSQGLAHALAAGSTVLLCPTMAPQDVEAIAARLHGLAIHCIDAPMSGGPARAADGSMSLMLACPEHVFVRNAALIHALSHKVFRVGERVGDGARTKLVNNLLAGINLVGAAEAIAMAQHMGLEAARTLDVIGQSSGQSWIAEDRMRRALAGDYAPRAHMTLLEKDTRLAVQAAAAAGFAGPLGAQAAEVFAQASRAGLAELDDAALLRFLQSKP
jgi:L-threonate 2-dehydrogenase